MTPEQTKGWTDEHKNIHAAIKVLEAQKKQAGIEFKKLKEQHEAKLKRLNSRINRLQNQCKHIDAGGPFVASCLVCGWADFYGDC